MPQKRKRHELEPGNWKLESGTKILIKILTQKKKKKKKKKQKKKKKKKKRNKLLTILPVFLTQVKAKNDSYRLENEIVDLLHQHNKITKKPYNNLIKSLW